MNDKNSTGNSLFHLDSIRIKIVFEGIAIGILTGLLIVLYRFSLEKALTLLLHLYKILAVHPWYLPVWIFCLIMIGLLLGLLVKHEPMISGSGIPQTEGVLIGKLDMKWWRVITGKFLGGVLSIGSGLSLGREGPSIQLGAAVGQGFSKVLKRAKVEEKYLITSGASAGLSAAFNAPLAGVMFALEEVHKNFSPLVLVSALSASLSAEYISKSFFGLKPVFNFINLPVLSLRYYLYIILLGIIIGVLGALFNKSLLGTQTLYSKLTWIPKKFHIILPLLISVIFGFFLPQVLGGGHELIVSIPEAGKYSILLLCVLLVAKFIFTMISYGSGAPGGIFLPLLTIGALIGGIYCTVLTNVFHMDSSYTITFLVLAMAGYFTAVVRAPITGIILITEMTGSFTHLLPVALISITAYIIADLLRSKPVYEALLERILHKLSNQALSVNRKHKAILEFAVTMGSAPDSKKVKEIDWPENCLLVAIKRGTREIIPKGNTVLLPGDYLVVLTNEDTTAEITDSFHEILKVSVT
jgi:H+/Cl- antiporter ClcA